MYLFTLCADSVEFTMKLYYNSIFYTKNNHEKVTLFCMFASLHACLSFYHITYELCFRYSFMILSILLMTQPNQMPHLCISNDHEIYINTWYKIFSTTHLKLFLLCWYADLFSLKKHKCLKTIHLIEAEIRKKEEVKECACLSDKEFLFSVCC